jgi:hypothetical protein
MTPGADFFNVEKICPPWDSVVKFLYLWMTDTLAFTSILFQDKNLSENLAPVAFAVAAYLSR